MRTVTFGVANSLDNYIARADHTVDWLYWSEDGQEVTAAFWKTIDTVVMGRKTWEAAQAMAAAGESGPEGLSAITTYVFSRTLREVSGGARLIREDAGEFVRDLKRQPGKGICVMGGGELARSLLEADVIDEVGLNIHPILLGSGVPLFRDPGRRVPLELIESRTIDGGCVLATYRVRPATGHS